MGVDSMMKLVGTVSTMCAETGLTVELQIWQGGGTVEVCKPGESRMMRLAQGHYKDIAGNEYVSSDPAAP